MVKQYEAMDFTHLLGTPGFSDDLLNTHFKLYNGYVTNTNNALKTLKEKAEKEDFDYGFGEVRRRFGWEFNGMRLHEYYFGLMKNGGSEFEKDTQLGDLMKQNWGSFDDWKTDFTKTGAMRGIGWVCLAYDPWSDRLINTWIGEHDVGNLAGSVPVLLLDVFEHAFIKDYGTDKAAYMKAYFEAIDWQKVNQWIEPVFKSVRAQAATA